MGFTTNQPFLDSPMAMETHKDLTCWPVKKTAHDSPPLSKRGTQVSQLKYVEIIEKWNPTLYPIIINYPILDMSRKRSTAGNPRELKNQHRGTRLPGTTPSDLAAAAPAHPTSSAAAWRGSTRDRRRGGRRPRRKLSSSRATCGGKEKKCDQTWEFSSKTWGFHRELKKLRTQNLDFGLHLGC